jgi:hypothetical protein
MATNSTEKGEEKNTEEAVRDGSLKESREIGTEEPIKNEVFRDGTLKESRAAVTSKEPDSKKNSPRGV